MRHNWFKEKDSSFKIISTEDTDVSVWKFTLDDGLTELDSVTPSAIGDYYKSTISTPDEDCFVFCKHNDRPGIIRVGNPAVLTIVYTGDTGETHSYVQYDMDGEELDSGDMIEIGEGFYYVEPTSLESSFFVLPYGNIKNLEVPYLVVEVSGDGVLSDGAFVNLGFNKFGFASERHSYFDLDQGKWINDDDVDAKASDLAKAVCDKYSLVWDDEGSDDYIGKYVKYLRTYTENDGKIRYYKPGTGGTPEDNAANFNLIQTDEGGNVGVKGIDLLLLQALETIDGTDGATITFKEN